MGVPDPLTLPSGGTVEFGDPVVLFKRKHFIRLAEIVGLGDAGEIRIPAMSTVVMDLAEVMTDALAVAWSGPPKWYLNDRKVPRDDPSVLGEISMLDLAALGNHLVSEAFVILGIQRKDAAADDPGKGGTRSSASNGSTPDTGSNPSSAATSLPAPSDSPPIPSSAGTPT